MAVQPRGFLRKTLEDIVSRPLEATLIVGTSIILLLEAVHYAKPYWPPVTYLNYMIPFIPSLFITRIAKRINRRNAEHDFIKDAEPYIFVAFPDACTESALLKARPVMISNRSARHLNCSISHLLQQEALPGEYISYEQRLQIIRRLISNYDRQRGEGAIRNHKVYIRPRGSEKSSLYLMSSKLERQDKALKWQATLMQHDPLNE